MANEVQTPADYLRWIQDVVEYHTDSELVSQDEICGIVWYHSQSQLICYREELGLPDPSWHESTRYFKRAALIGIGKFLKGINKASSDNRSKRGLTNHQQKPGASDQRAGLYYICCSEEPGRWSRVILPSSAIGRTAAVRRPPPATMRPFAIRRPVVHDGNATLEIIGARRAPRTDRAICAMRERRFDQLGRKVGGVVHIGGKR